MSPTTTPDAQALALVKAQAAIREQTTAQAVAMATASARGFTGWYDSQRITAWAAKLAGQIEALQRFLAQSTDAYLARALTQATGRTVRPVGRVDVADLRSGVTHAGSYARAADAYRWQQSQFDQTARDLVTGTPTSPPVIVDPIEAAVQRVAKVADYDAQLAVRAQSHAVISGQGELGTVTGFRRVIHPEESKGGSCGLCVAASHRVYGPTELLPIHSRCACTTLPIVEGWDPGARINKDDLSKLYQVAGGTGKQQLAAIRYQVDEHGELGPVLNVEGAKVRTARKAAADTDKARPGKTDAEKHAALTKTRDAFAQALPRARELAATDPKQWGDYLDKLEARVTDLTSQLTA